MSDSKKSIKPQRVHILQKDLSFSNQIFKKSLNPDQNKSIKESTQAFHHNMIPPLVKYHEEPASILYKQNLNQGISSFNQKISQPDLNSNSLNIFTKQKIFGSEFNDETNNFSPSGNLPPLSKLEEKIYKKYQRSNDKLVPQIQNIPQNEQQNSKINSQKTKVYFDKTDKLEEVMLNQKDSKENVLDIDSLEESRIANDSIEKHNNWLLSKNNQSQQFLDSRIQKNNKSQRSFALNNQSFRRFNPLTLVNNSLHTSNLPEFIQDDDSASDNRSLNNEKNYKEPESNILNFPKFQGNKINKNANQRFAAKQILNDDRNRELLEIPSKKKEIPICQITLGLFSHYLQGCFKHDFQQGSSDLKDEGISSILINQPSQNFGFDNLTSKSSPTYNKVKDKKQQKNNNKSMSEVDNLSRNLDFSIDSYSQQNSNQNFIRDKNSQEIIASLLKDENKAKIFIKYLQIKISENSENVELCKNYELLSGILCKIPEITDKSVGNKHPNALAQSILEVYASKRGEVKESQRPKASKPQIIRSSNQVKIDFDPYLKSQKILLNQKISSLKKVIEEKNKSTELIKLTYDGIIHNYAITLQNLTKKAQNNLTDAKPQYQEFKQHTSVAKNQMKSDYSDNLEANNNLDVLNFNRSSLQGYGIHRKATFGKAPLSFRGSESHDS